MDKETTLVPVLGYICYHDPGIHLVNNYYNPGTSTKFYLVDITTTTLVLPSV